MSPERWRQAEPLFHAALERPADEREAFLNQSCDDDTLRQDVKALLECHSSPGSPLDRPAWETPRRTGEAFGPYRLEERLGAGGMGEVYRATDSRLRRSVALKLLPPLYSADPERLSRFEREARVLASLNHPNIAAIYGLEAGAIVMELVEGPTLADLLEKGPVPDALKIAKQIAEALEYAHDKGIIHRDLKPANIKISADGVVKVLDFGLAKAVTPGASTEGLATVTATRAGTILGTPAYMAPEQASGAEVDRRVDIWAFGAVLWEMLTGRRLFGGETVTETLAQVLRDPIDLEKLPRDVPAAVRILLGRCLERNARDRLRDIGEARVTLQNVAKEQPVSQKPVRSGPIARLAVVMMLLGAGIWVWQRNTAPAAPQTVVPVTTLQGSEGGPRFSPDGKQIAFNWNQGRAGNSNIFVKLLGETNALQLTSGGSDFSPAWSPDGKRIAFVRGGSNPGIYSVSALGGEERKLRARDSVVAFPQLSWSPDGKWLVSAEGAIVLLPLDGGNPRFLSHPRPLEEDRSPAFSLDGRRLAYVRSTGVASCDIYIQDLNTDYTAHGEPRQVLRAASSIGGLTWSRDGRSLIYSGGQVDRTLIYLWRIGIDGRQPPQRLDIAGPGAYSPSVSPTANRVVYESYFADSDIWRYQVGGAMEAFIVSSLPDSSPQYSPDGSKIAFESARNGQNQEVWLVNADGSRPFQLTNHVGGRAGTPRWSPDGQWIAFDSQGQDGHWDIYVVEAAGGAPRRLTSEPSDQNLPAWSRDGKWIYFTSSRRGRPEIWRIPFSGGKQEQITTDGGVTAFESADGKTLFYTKSAGDSPLFSRLLPGGGERRVLPSIRNRAFFPVADGIYYIAAKNGEGSFPLEFFEFASNSSRLLAKIGGGLGVGLAVSPDRKTILFSKITNAGSDLMMIENFQ